MSEKREKISIGGEIVDSIGVEFKTIEENWNRYQLQDGTLLKIKIVPVRVTRAENKFNKHGEPVYHVRHQVILVPEAIPEELMKKD